MYPILCQCTIAKHEGNIIKLTTKSSWIVKSTIGRPGTLRNCEARSMGFLVQFCALLNPKCRSHFTCTTEAPVIDGVFLMVKSKKKLYQSLYLDVTTKLFSHLVFTVSAFSNRDRRECLCWFNVSLYSFGTTKIKNIPNHIHIAWVKVLVR